MRLNYLPLLLVMLLAATLSLPAFAQQPEGLSPIIKPLPSRLILPPWGVGNDQRNVYFIALLKLALAKTEAEDGPVELQLYPANLPSARFMADLKNHKTIDIIWNGTSPQRERELLPIRFSLLKDLNESRVLLIRKEDQWRFDEVRSLADLRRFTAGAGADWPSAEILRHNKMPVLTVATSSLLFPMLRAKRFDYISRNLSEAAAEAQAFEKEGLVIERNLLLRGGVPFYFFVHKDNHQLAARIERGLQRAQADGSFEALFLHEPGFRQGQEMQRDPNRRVLQLEVR